jgi:hypothetical protein
VFFVSVASKGVIEGAFVSVADTGFRSESAARKEFASEKAGPVYRRGEQRHREEKKWSGGLEAEFQKQS